ncbi:MAG: hypothetical protein AVDCRST_MAG65-1157, partial [uncultured Solirubrobacteraceae bacterium]
ARCRCRSHRVTARARPVRRLRRRPPDAGDLLRRNRAGHRCLGGWCDGARAAPRRAAPPVVPLSL